MAKGKKTGGRPFAKGNKANPIGGGALSPEVRAIRTITRDTVNEVASLILESNITKLKEIANSTTETALRVWVARAAVKALDKGDYHTLEMILCRVLGKPKEDLSLTFGKSAESPSGFFIEGVDDKGQPTVNAPQTIEANYEVKD